MYYGDPIIKVSNFYENCCRVIDELIMEAPEKKLVTVPLPEDDFIKYNFKYNTPLCFYLNKYSPAACNLKVIDELFANGCMVYEECLYDASVPGHEWRISVIKNF